MFFGCNSIVFKVIGFLYSLSGTLMRTHEEILTRDLKMFNEVEFHLVSMGRIIE